MSIKRVINSENVSKIARVSANAENGFDVQLPSGSTIKNVHCQGNPSLPVNSWVTIIQNGSNWQIIGRAASAPNDPNA